MSRVTKAIATIDKAVLLGYMTVAFALEKFLEFFQKNFQKKFIEKFLENISEIFIKQITSNKIATMLKVCQ